MPKMACVMPNYRQTPSNHLGSLIKAGEATRGTPDGRCLPVAT